MAEILRCMELRGDDLQTNLARALRPDQLVPRQGRDGGARHALHGVVPRGGRRARAARARRRSRARLRRSSLRRAARRRGARACSRRRRRCSLRPLAAPARERRTCSAASSAASTACSGRTREQRAALRGEPDPLPRASSTTTSRWRSAPDTPPSEKIWDHDAEILARALGVLRRGGATHGRARATTSSTRCSRARAIASAVRRRRRALARCRRAHRGLPARARAAAADPAHRHAARASSRSTVDETLAGGRSRSASPTPEHARRSCVKALAPPPAASCRRDRHADGRHLLRARGAAPAAARSRWATTSRPASRSSSSR